MPSAASEQGGERVQRKQREKGTNRFLLEATALRRWGTGFAEYEETEVWQGGMMVAKAPRVKMVRPRASVSTQWSPACL